MSTPVWFNTYIVRYAGGYAHAAIYIGLATVIVLQCAWIVTERIRMSYLMDSMMVFHTIVSDETLTVEEQREGLEQYYPAGTRLQGAAEYDRVVEIAREIAMKRVAGGR